jgi:hypothetical protein
LETANQRAVLSPPGESATFAIRRSVVGEYRWVDSRGLFTVFRFGETLVNLLKTSEAPGLVEPATVATRDAGVRFQFTLGVDDVDAMWRGTERAWS